MTRNERYFIEIPLAFAAATYSAGAVLDALQTGGSVSYVLVHSVAITLFGIALSPVVIPLVAAIAVSEIFSLRSALVWLVFGAVVGLAGGSLASHLELSYGESVSAGGIWALVYWLLAGRRAGQRLSPLAEANADGPIWPIAGAAALLGGIVGAAVGFYFAFGELFRVHGGHDVMSTWVTIGAAAGAGLFAAVFVISRLRPRRNL